MTRLRGSRPACRPSALFCALLMASPGALGGHSVRLAAHVDAPARGDALVAIEADLATPIASARLRFAYDPQLMHPEEVFRTTTTRDVDLEVDTSERGVVTLSLRGVIEPRRDGSSRLADVRFRVRGPHGAASALRWLSADVDGARVEVTTDGVLEVGGGTALAFPDETRVAPDGIAWIPLELSGPLPAGPLEIEVVFDPDLLEWLDAQPSALAGSLRLQAHRKSSGRLRVVLDGGTSRTGEGALAYLAFRAVGPRGSRAPLDLREARAGRQRLALDDGGVTICDWRDADRDGYGGCTGDCDDEDPATRPLAAETCDGRDNDCDGARDRPLREPSTAADLQLARDGSRATLTWSAVDHALDFEVVQGPLERLPHPGTDPAGAWDCLEVDPDRRQAVARATPLPGRGYWFVVRPLGCRSQGSFDSASGSQIGSRAIATEWIPSCMTTKDVARESPP